MSELDILRSVLDECKLHERRLHFACERVSSLLPFTTQSVEAMSDDTVSFLDQFIFRFAKLQDAMGTKLFKVLLAALGEDFSNRPLLDIFHRLEQLGIIGDYERWQRLRVLRNQVAHDYDMSPMEQAERLNALLGAYNTLTAYLYDIQKYCQKRGWE